MTTPYEILKYAIQSRMADGLPVGDYDFFEKALEEAAKLRDLRTHPGERPNIETEERIPNLRYSVLGNVTHCLDCGVVVPTHDGASMHKCDEWRPREYHQNKRGESYPSGSVKWDSNSMPLVTYGAVGPCLEEIMEDPSALEYKVAQYCMRNPHKCEGIVKEYLMRHPDFLKANVDRELQNLLNDRKKAKKPRSPVAFWGYMSIMSICVYGAALAAKYLQPEWSEQHEALLYCVGIPAVACFFTSLMLFVGNLVDANSKNSVSRKKPGY